MKFFASEGSAQIILIILGIARKVLDFEIEGDIMDGVREKMDEFVF